MRAVVQRVFKARVIVNNQVVGAINRGLVAFIGAGKDDTDSDIETVASKIANLRVFEDDRGKMSRSITDESGSLLAISQFTVFGDVRRGRRPSFDGAMEPIGARRLFESLIANISARGIHVSSGQFGADMRVDVCNDGPVTILIDSRKTF